MRWRQDQRSPFSRKPATPGERCGKKTGTDEQTQKHD